MPMVGLAIGPVRDCRDTRHCDSWTVASVSSRSYQAGYWQRTEETPCCVSHEANLQRQDRKKKKRYKQYGGSLQKAM